jgi:predicted nucleic acid-binding protein
LKLYLDASVLVSLIVSDALSAHAETLTVRQEAGIFISDFAAVEVASAIARRVRMRTLTEQEARSALTSFDIFTAQMATRIEAVPADIKAAEAALRRLDLSLRTGDALNIAIADRLGATLATFDRKMAGAARALGVPVVEQDAG